MPRAGLAPASVTEAGAALADEVGFDQLSMGLLAERLGVKTPSLYKHVDSLADLAHRIAVLAMIELGDAAARRHPGSGRQRRPHRRRAGHAHLREGTPRPVRRRQRRPTRPDPTTRSSRRATGCSRSLSAVLRGYQLDPSQEIHALRMLRSMLHGFATLEVDGGFRFDTDVDDSFTWMVNLIDQGLQSLSPRRAPASG